MGKKNIKPNLNQPIIRQNVAKPALEGLMEENLTTTTAEVVGIVPGAVSYTHLTLPTTSRV